MKAKNKMILCVFALFSSMLTGCQKSRLGLTEEPDKAKIAIMNVVTPNRPTSTSASSGLLGYYLFMDNFQMFTQSLIPNKTTGYVLANPGSHIIRVDSTAQVTNAIKPFATVNTTTIQAEAGKYYSVFYTGKVQAPEVVVTKDDLTRPPAGKSKVRVIHLSPDAGTLTIAGALTTATTLNAMFSNLTYKTEPVFTNINEGYYKLELRDNGTGAALGTFTQTGQMIPSFIPGGSVQSSFTIKFESEMVYTLVIRGYRTPAISAVGQIANPLSVGVLINVYF